MNRNLTQDFVKNIPKDLITEYKFNHYSLLVEMDVAMNNNQNELEDDTDARPYYPDWIILKVCRQKHCDVEFQFYQWIINYVTKYPILWDNHLARFVQMFRAFILDPPRMFKVIKGFNVPWNEDNFLEELQQPYDSGLDVDEYIYPPEIDQLLRSKPNLIEFVEKLLQIQIPKFQWGSGIQWSHSSRSNFILEFGQNLHDFQENWHLLPPGTL